ncbi:MAG: hypothetical protein HY298_10530 [Verrucomicrobia bacterium]|nr:hypothetical protein [Verrucomicrobiota bacterium]
MRLFEAIIDANHRALAGDETAGLHPADFADSLRIMALTGIDAGLNPLISEALSVREQACFWPPGPGQQGAQCRAIIR